MAEIMRESPQKDAKKRQKKAGSDGGAAANVRKTRSRLQSARLLDFSYSNSISWAFWHGFWPASARHPCRPRQPVVQYGCRPSRRLGNVIRTSGAGKKGVVIELAVEFSPHSNRNQQRYVQALCSSSRSMTAPFDTSHVSPDPYYRLTPTGGGNRTSELRMVSILVEITTCKVSCL